MGERWALLVVRKLLLGPKRFADLAGPLASMSHNVLTQRLRELEESGVLTRRALGPPTSSRVYELSPWGTELEPVLLALGCWDRLTQPRCGPWCSPGARWSMPSRPAS